MMTGKAWWQECEPEDYIAFTRTLVPSQLSPFYLAQDPSLPNDAAYIQDGSFLLVSKLLWKCPHRHAKVVS